MKFLKFLIKSLIKEIYSILLRIKVLFLNKTDKTIIFDIDNTLANSWPTLTDEIKANYANEIDRLSNLPLLEGAKELVEYALDNFDRVLFLSARDPRHYNVTMKWIKNNFGNFEVKLVLVPKVNLKVLFWLRLAKLSNKITVVDDLSYNHENDFVRFYLDEINLLRKHDKINYYDFNDIQNGLRNIKNKI